MKNIRFVLAMASFVALESLAISLTTCGGTGGPISVAVTPANPSIPAGVVQQFAATGTFSDGTTRDITTQVTWSSSNTSAATVNSNGLATAVAAGTATITATSGDISGSTTLTVTSATLSSISVTPANSSIPTGFIQQLTATGAYSDGTSFDITIQVTWSSSNTLVATVNNSGLAAASLVGTATITATSGSISGSTTLTVTSAALSSISVTPANSSIPVGVSQQFTAIGIFSDGTSFNITKQVTWSSSNTLVATVDSSGLAAALAAGATIVTATSGIASGSGTLTVTSAALSSISITPANPSIPVGGTQQLTATGTYSDGTTFDITTQVTWKSLNLPVATVDSSGLGKAVATGTATITATSGSISGSTSFTVISS